jgi:hypothetical protein
LSLNIFSQSSKIQRMSTTRYRKVSQNENQLADEEQKKAKSERLDRISSKIHALVWVFLAAIVVYYTDLFHVIMHSEQINRLVSFVNY